MWNEPNREMAALLHPANGNRSIDEVIVKSGSGVLAAGTVMATFTTAGADKGKLVPYADSGSAGAGTATHVLGAAVDATSADVPAKAIARDAEIIDGELVFGASVNDATKRAKAISDLALQGLIAR